MEYGRDSKGDDIPTGDEEAVVVDYATSAAAEGKVLAALLRGEKLPLEPPGRVLALRTKSFQNKNNEISDAR
ncbi:MAG: hypothetical protein ACHQ03_08565 [Candidatus Bathyarchaeia archaeon]